MKMKVLLLAMVVMFAGVAHAQDKIIAVNQLPASAQSFIKDHYVKASVTLVKMEQEFMSKKTYTVSLSDKVEIEFDSKGNWTEVDADLHAVPAKLVPAAIQSYAKKSFPNNEIVQIEKSARKYKIELTNGVDLEFTDKGEFVRIDD